MRPHPPGRPALVVVGMTAVLALLVGLVRSGGRASGGPRPAGTAARERAAEAPVELRDPGSLPPLSAEPEPVPAAATRTAPPAPGRLVGAVVRQDGAPAAGARVRLGRQQALCDEDGEFELVLLDASEADGGLDLVAHQPGSEPALLSAFGAGLDPRGENRARIVLGAPTLALAGRVEHEDGSPAKGWSVELEGFDPLADLGLRAAVHTDVDGRFELADVPGGVHVLAAHRGARALAYRSAPVAAGETGIVIVVGR